MFQRTWTRVGVCAAAASCLSGLVLTPPAFADSIVAESWSSTPPATPTTLCTDSIHNSNSPPLPQVALSSNGERATAVWRCGSGSTMTIQTASAMIHGNTALWSTPITLDSGTVVVDAKDSPQISMSSDGSRATVIWNSKVGGVSGIRTVLAKSIKIVGNTQTVESGQPVVVDTDVNALIPPALQVSNDGTKAVAGYTEIVSARSETNAAFLTVDYSGATPVTTVANTTQLSDGSTSLASTTSLGIGLSGDGDATVAVWASDDGLVQTVNGFTSYGVGSIWDTAHRLNLSSGGTLPVVRLAKNSTSGSYSTTAIWYDTGSSEVIAGTAKLAKGGSPTDGVWNCDAMALSAPTCPSISSSSGAADTSYGAPGLALSGDGATALAVWDDSSYIARSNTASIVPTTGVASWNASSAGPGQSGWNARATVSANGARSLGYWIAGDSPYHLTNIAGINSGNTTTWDTDHTLTISPTTDEGSGYMWEDVAAADNGLIASAVWVIDDGSNYIVQTGSAAIPPAITSSSTASVAQGSHLNFTVTTTGTPSAAIGETGTLPTGVTLTDHGDGTATLAGTPSASGTFPIVMTANNDTAPEATQDFTLTVTPDSGRKHQTLPAGAVPANLANPGMTVVNKRDARTVQDRPVTARVRVQLAKGSVRCAAVKHGSARKVSFVSTGLCKMTVRVTYRAPGDAHYFPYSKSVVYQLPPRAKH